MWRMHAPAAPLPCAKLISPSQLSNLNARFREPVSLEEVLGSRAIADPITLLQCSRNGSGAAALVVASEVWCRRRASRPVFVAGSGLASWMSDKTTRDL